MKKRLIGLTIVLIWMLSLPIGYVIHLRDVPPPMAANPRPLTYQFVSEERAASFEEVKNADNWSEQYPHVVASFSRGGEASREDIDQYGVFAQNGHSILEQTFFAAYPDTPESFSVACLACHSSGYEWAYEAYGDDVLDIVWANVKADHPGMDFWSCCQCHGNKPGEILTTNAIYSGRITDDIPNFAPGEAVCAQCHTVFTGLEALTSDLEGVYDVHKNGYDVDGYTRQRENDPGKYQQRDYSTGFLMGKAKALKG
ncbi:MAG: hypothetical protein ACOX63_14390 [Christensenellales bacterium]|jgi:hypothetical protein